MFRQWLVIRLIGVAVLSVLYDAVDNVLLRELFSFSVCRGVEIIGATGDCVVNGTRFSVNGIDYSITAECLYLDWVICVAPFAIITERKVGSLITVMAVTCIALLWNYIRVCFAVYMNSNGVSWFWSHDLIDYCTWYPSVCAVSLLLVWRRYRDRRHGNLSQQGVLS